MISLLIQGGVAGLPGHAATFKAEKDMLNRIIFFSIMTALLCFGVQRAVSAPRRAAQPAVESRPTAGAMLAGALKSAGQDNEYAPVTIAQLRADPKGYAQKKVAITGKVAEPSRSEQSFELVQNGEQLHVLVSDLAPEEQARVYAAKPGSRVTALGEFSGYVLFAARIKFVK